MTDEMARHMIAERIGHPMRSLSGVTGDFYTVDREKDLRNVVDEILAERIRVYSDEIQE